MHAKLPDNSKPRPNRPLDLQARTPRIRHRPHHPISPKPPPPDRNHLLPVAISDDSRFVRAWFMPCGRHAAIRLWRRPGSSVPVILRLENNKLRVQRVVGSEIETDASGCRGHRKQKLKHRTRGYWTPDFLARSISPLSNHRVLSAERITQVVVLGYERCSVDPMWRITSFSSVGFSIARLSSWPEKHFVVLPSVPCARQKTSITKGISEPRPVVSIQQQVIWG